MAITTSPDNIPSPTSGDPYNYVVDMAAIADGTRDALTQKANMGVGTSTQRVAALSKFPDGALWFDTTLSTTWRRIAGAWVPTPGNNYGVGTTTQRTAALGGFPDGALWYDTTTASEWRRVAGAWVNQDTGWLDCTREGSPGAYTGVFKARYFNGATEVRIDLTVMPSSSSGSYTNLGTLPASVINPDVSIVRGTAFTGSTMTAIYLTTSGTIGFYNNTGAPRTALSGSLVCTAG